MFAAFLEIAHKEIHWNFCTTVNNQHNNNLLTDKVLWSQMLIPLMKYNICINLTVL